MVSAQEVARKLQHNYIGTEHVLLGLLTEPSNDACLLLSAMSIGAGSVRRQLLELIGKGPGSPPGHIPFTPRARKCLEMSLRESLGLGHGDVGTGHILLGLLADAEGVASQVLTRHGVEREQARVALSESLGSSGDTRKVGPETTLGPICPSCRQPVSQRLRLLSEHIDATPINVAACGVCGVVLGVFPG